MKKSIISLVTSLAVFSLAMTFSITAQPVHAQVANCPAGYTCTPVAPQFSGCPVGYTCTPVTTTTTQPPVSNSGSGTVGNPTSCYSLSDHLGIGSRSADVVALQTFLIAKGFDIPLISHGGISKGYFGPSTAASLAKYQSSIGVSPTGVFGAVTRSNINSSLCNQNNNPQSPTAATSASFTVSGTPTFTQNVVNTDQSGNQITQYIASFNIQVAAVGGNAILGLPGSTYPFISAVSPFISIYKNGVADSLSNYTAIASYAQPTNTTIVNGSSFTVVKNQTVTVPVTISFQVRNPGANVYGVRLNQVAWSTPLPSSSNQTAILSGTNFAGNGVPQPPTCPTGQTWNGTSCVTTTTGNSQISLITDTSSSNAVSGAYQVNLSFNGGTAAQPVSSWNLYIQCPSNMDVNTVPGASCNSAFQMGTNGQNYGNVSSKAFWFKNYSGSTQTANLSLTGYNSSNGVLGTYQANVQIPPTSSGQQTWSQVTVVSPNGGESFVAGQPMTITWRTTSGTFQFLPTSNVQIYLEQSNPGQSNVVKATFSNLPNSGSATVTIPATVPAGSNYKVNVQVYAEAPAPSGSAQADDSDSTFTVIAPATPTCPAGQTWSGSMCTVQVQPSSGQPYVSIISPNGGEQYTQGQTVPISFSTNLTSQQAPNGFNIWAYYGGNSTNVGSYASGVQSIAMNWTGGSPYSWTIPSSMATGNYVMYIVPTNVAPGVSNTGLFAFGNSYFTISAQTTQPPTCPSGQTWNGSSCVSPSQPSTPVVSNVSVDKASYNVGDSYTVTWNLANAPTNGHIGIALENQSGVRVYNVVNTCDYVSNCVNIPATSGPGTYTGTIPSGVGSIGSSVSNGQYKFEVELIANGAFVTDGVSSQTVSIPLGGGTPTATNASVQVSVNGTPTITKNVITTGGGTTQVNQYLATFNVSVQASGAPVTLGLPNSSWPAFVATAAGIQVNKNGVADPLSNYNPVVSYSAPSNATISSDGTSFTVGQNQTVTIPVTVAFTVTNPGANVYSVQLLGMGWSASGQSNQIAPLGGSTWQTQSAMSSDNSSLTASIWDAIRQYYAGQ